MKSKKDFVVYMILCADKSLYTGITTDIERRFAEHAEGIGARYTKSHLPKRIVYSEARHTHSSALIREAEIKKLTKVQKLLLCKIQKTAI